MAKQQNIGKVAESLLTNLNEVIGLIDGINESLESRPLKAAVKALKTAEKAADKLVVIAEGLLDDLAQAEEEDEEEEDDDEEWDDDD